MSQKSQNSNDQSDRIERSVVLKAPRSRVWRALTDYKEFGTWFRAKLEGPFVVGEKVNGMHTYPGYEHLPFHAIVDRMDAESVFSFRWPASSDDGAPLTRVEFTLEDAEGGTKLTVIESGFEHLPAEMRDKVFRDNTGGWEKQLENIEAHVS